MMLLDATVCLKHINSKSHC